MRSTNSGRGVSPSSSSSSGSSSTLTGGGVGAFEGSFEFSAVYFDYPASVVFTSSSDGCNVSFTTLAVGL